MPKRKSTKNTETKSKKQRNVVTLAHKYNPEKHKITPNEWYWSLKLDGIRAYWDIHDNKLKTRNNKLIMIPNEWLELFKKINLPFDGELIHQDVVNKFKETISIVRRTKNVDHEKWKNEIEFHIFDIIDTNKTFEQRYKHIQEHVPKNTFLQIVKQNVVTENTNIIDELNKVVKNDHEGLMLKKMDSLYEHKRSKSLLKVKIMHDTEVVVKEIVKGQGKYENVMGAVVCDYNGTDISIGSGFSDFQRQNPPFKPGDVITIQYFEKTQNSLRFPIFLRVRNDQ